MQRCKVQRSIGSTDGHTDMFTAMLLVAIMAGFVGLVVTQE